MAQPPNYRRMHGANPTARWGRAGLFSIGVQMPSLVFNFFSAFGTPFPRERHGAKSRSSAASFRSTGDHSCSITRTRMVLPASSRMRSLLWDFLAVRSHCSSLATAPRSIRTVAVGWAEALAGMGVGAISLASNTSIDHY